MGGQGTVEMETGNKPWMKIVSKLKAMTINEKQNIEISLFIMVSYDLDTFWQFVFESTFLERFEVDKNTVISMRSDQESLFKFGMQWLQYALFKEGTIRPKVNK